MSYKIILLFSIFSLSLSQQEICRQPQCVSYLQNDTCISPLSEVITYMQPCPDGKICNTLSELLDEEAKCIPKTEISYKKYPGMECNTDDDCFTNGCQDNKCKATAENEVCTSVEQCDYGFTCRSVEGQKICTKPLEEGEACSEDTDCKLTLGCLNNKCTPYFSVEDGQTVSKSSFTPMFSFCKSGYSNEKGECQSLVQDTRYTECDDGNACKYHQKDDETPIYLYNKCQCGYSQMGKKFCSLGSGEYNYTRYINYLKNYYSTSNNCHLAERGGDGCLKDILYGDSTVKTQLKKLYSYKLWALSNYKMYDTLPCVYQIEFPDYDPTSDDPEPVPPKPVKYCAKYTCKDNLKSCAEVESPSISSIEVTLSDVCTGKEKCNIGGEPNDVFYRLNNETFTCALPEIHRERYPGEECETNADCIFPIGESDNKFHKCENNKCSGYEKGHGCTKTEQCLAGTYCDLEQATCQAQKGSGDDCLDSYECKNDLLCYKGQCQNALFSLEAGTDLSDINFDHKEKYCQFESIYQNTKCAEIRDGKKDEFVSCNLGDTCTYTYFPAELGTIEIPCECGYNDKGIGYCRKFHDYQVDDWEQLALYKKRLYNNKCHSKSRYNCYIEDQDNNEQISLYTNKLMRAHLFHDAVKCAEKVLSGNVLKMNHFISLVLVFALLI